MKINLGVKRTLTIFFYVCIVAIIIGANSFRFMSLEQVPAGFHVDELSFAVTVQCLATEGVDYKNDPYPLFSDPNYGNPRPPTSLYFGVLWTKLFGFSIPSFRAMTAFKAILTIIGLFFLSRVLFNAQYGLFVVLAASVSPWVFQISRLGIESFFTTCFMVWGMYFALKSHKYIDLIIAGILFSLAMYTYPPTRLQLPLFIITLILFKKYRHGIQIKPLLASVLACTIFTIPLAIKVFSGELMARVDKLSIFSSTYLDSIGQSNNFLSVFGIFWKNFWQHFHPSFLLFEGGSNPVYSTQSFGLLSWLDMFAIALGCIILMIGAFKWLKNKCGFNGAYTALIVFLLVNILISVIPSALTWQDVPHALRVQSMWPFISLLTGFILWRGAQSQIVLLPIMIGIVIGFLTIYLKYYFQVYYRKSAGWFSYHTKVLALNAKNNADWRQFAGAYRAQNFHLRYYLMNYKEGETCSSTLKLWNAIIKAP